jgi:hypothetical protein
VLVEPAVLVEPVGQAAPVVLVEPVELVEPAVQGPGDSPTFRPAAMRRPLRR